MAVETRYAVMHKGEEKLVTTSKSEADRYDKMLSVADNLVEYLEDKGIIPENADEQTLSLIEAIGITLSQGKDDVKKLLAGRTIADLSPEPKENASAT